MGKQIVLNWTRFLTLVMTLGLSGMVSQESWGQAIYAPKITSDKDDYLPGEIATISGTGWTKDQTVELHIEEDPYFGDAYFFESIPVDENGNWSVQIEILERHLGVAFTAYAVGHSTGATAYTYFTDGNITFSTTGLPNGISVAVNWSHTQGQGQSGTMTFNSPGPSASLGVNNQTFSYSFPVNLSLNGSIYTLSSSSPSSGFNTGAGNVSIIVNGVYEITCSSATISTQPSNQSITYGSGASFSVVYSGVGTKTLQWQVNTGSGFINISNGVIYSGVNSETLTVSNPTVAMSGYQYRVIISGGCGTPVTSNPASLIVNKKEISGNFTADNKVYDGNTSATVLTRTLNGVISPDAVTLVGGTATFADANAAIGKTVTLAGATLSGANAGNYTLTAVNNTTANIDKAPTVTTVTINGGPFTYTGSAITPATVTVTGAGGLNLTPAASYANNINAGTATASYSYAESANHLASSDSEDFTINKASTVTTVTINGGPFTYTGSAIEPATVTVTGAGGLNLTPATSYANNVNAGTATASYSYAESPNHLASSDSKTFEIGKANATIDVQGKTVTYDGTAHGATGTAKGVMGEDLAGLDLGASFTNVPGGTANWTYTDVTGNYNNASGSVAININKAPTVTTVTINGGPFTYTGSAITPATVTVTGAGGLSLTPAASYVNNINAGTATASYSYSESPNHLGSSDSKTFEIGKANATIDVQGKTVTYDGTAHGATGTAKGVMGDDLAGLDLGASFTNVPGGTANWTFTDVTGNYNNASGSVAININKAPTVTTVTINGGPFTYTGSAITPATVTVTGAGGLNLTPAASYVNNINAGTATASYSYEESANHLASSDSKTFEIGKANATIDVIGKTVTYDGTAHGATGTAKGVMGEDLAGLNLGATFTDVPGGTANWTFTGGTNYKDQSGSVAITITKADATVNVTGYTGVYDALPHGASGTATGVGDVDLSSGLNLGATFTDVPGGTANWTFTGGMNYKDQSGSVAITITKADATVNVIGYTGVYDALPHGASGTATGVGGVDLSSGLNLGATFTDVPGGTANWTFTGGTNYKDQNGSVVITITKADATVNVTGYTGVYDALPHGASGTATGVGGVDLSSGLNLGATFTDVPGGTANWTFTGGTNYKDQSGSVAITINKADATVNVIGYTGVYDALPHGAIGIATGVGGADLSSGLNLGSTFTDVPGGTANWTFTGGTNYKDQSGSVAITITKADATVNVIGYTGVYDALPHGAIGIATGVGGADLSSGLNLGSTFTDVPGGIANWTFTGGTNYKDQSGSVAIVINKAPTVTTVTINGGPFTYTGSAITPAMVTVTGAGGLSLTPAASYMNNINAGTATASYSYEESTNYLASSDSKNFTIGKANATIVVQGKAVTYDGTAHGATGTAKGVMGESLAGLNLGSSFTNVPGGTADWSFTDITGNYNYTSGSVAIEINPRPITISANAGQFKYCGQVDPTSFAFTPSETLLAGNSFSGKLGRTSGEGVNTYPLNIGSLSAGPNYSLTLIGSNTFEIEGITIDASATSTPVAVGSLATLKATVSPAVAGIAVVFTVDNGNGIVKNYSGVTNTSGLATATVPATDLPVEVYLVTAIAGTGCTTSIAYLPVFDPNGGFVTGGGWILSPAGALTADPLATGKANFGFNAKYKKGTSTVDGNTEFQFQAGNINFKSSVHESGSLVITTTNGKATYRGDGTVNGVPGYKFSLTAFDGNWVSSTTPDRFRIKIWNAGGVVYDNQNGKADNTDDATIIGGGSIVIHSPAKGNKRVSTELITVAWNTPVETIKQKVDQMSLTWFESRKLPLVLYAGSYDPLTPGLYELKADLMDNEFFALDDPISIQVLVQDKPKAMDILVDNSKLTTDLKAGDVLGILRTIDPVDDIHTYQIGENANLLLDGDKLIWKGITVPAQLRLTVFSTDRAGQTINREISLSRELKPGEFFLYPNPAQRETNVMVDLDREATVAIRIYDAVGRMVVENESFREGSFTQTFNLDGLAAGFYTVQVKVGDMVMTKRLIKR